MLEKLKFSMEELEQACEKWGLKINTDKCKIISPGYLSNIKIGSTIVELLEELVFLGSVVPNMADDVKGRIALASSTFGGLKKNVWSRKEILNHIKMRLYSALIVPIAIYTYKSWTLKAEDEQKYLKWLL